MYELQHLFDFAKVAGSKIYPAKTAAHSTTKPETAANIANTAEGGFE